MKGGPSPNNDVIYGSCVMATVKDIIIIGGHEEQIVFIREKEIVENNFRPQVIRLETTPVGLTVLSLKRAIGHSRVERASTTGRPSA